MFERYGTYLLMLFLAITSITPLLLTFPAWFSHADFSHTGEIGDTIGGITAPFINGMATLLVFLAYKAQTKANEILNISNKQLRDQDEARGVMEQIKSIQTDTDSIVGTITVIVNRIGEMQSGMSLMMAGKFGQLKFQFNKFLLALEMIDSYGGDKTFLTKNLTHLYNSTYKELFGTMFLIIDSNIGGVKMHSDYRDRLNWLKESFEKLNVSLTIK